MVSLSISSSWSLPSKLPLIKMLRASRLTLLDVSAVQLRLLQLVLLQRLERLKLCLPLLCRPLGHQHPQVSARQARPPRLLILLRMQQNQHRHNLFLPQVCRLLLKRRLPPPHLLRLNVQSTCLLVNSQIFQSSPIIPSTHWTRMEKTRMSSDLTL